MTKLSPERRERLLYTGHHNLGPLHIAADIAILCTIAGATGFIVLGFVAIAVVALLIFA